MTEVRFDPCSVDPAPAERSPWWGVHASRYLFAAAYVDGRKVLDVACGTGYGVSILQGRARCVVAVDADFDAARKARRAGNRHFHSVLVGDGRGLPFAAGTFDAVTSFETLEHLEHRDRFLAEIWRVLAVDGMCLISTPNAHYTRPINGRPRNPFHVYEYTPEELKAELRPHFLDIELRGQVLSARYSISPFWDDQQRLPKTVGAQARLLAWRILNRLPFPARERVAQALWRHPFTPTETDYDFTRDFETAPVIMAICRRRSST